jgi:predicted DCC family thiol-disulfide oxidoreductase YuxK
MEKDLDMQLSGNQIILFDGVCNLCNSSVDFIVKRDKKNIFKFASLQSPFGQAVLEKFNLPPQEFQSVLLIKNGKIFQKSSAGLEIARQISGFWFLLYSFIIVPSFIRDWVYDFIAQNRYHWFGKKETCRLPTPQERAKFLG